VWVFVALYTGESYGSFKPSRSYHPSELRPKDGGPYICYGVYDSAVDHTNRVGYMGRVWLEHGGTAVKYCDPRPAREECSPVPCCWKADPTADDPDCLNYRNNADEYVEQCTERSGLIELTCVLRKAKDECSGITSGESSDVECCWLKGTDGKIKKDGKCENFRNTTAGYVEQYTSSEWTPLYEWDDGVSGACTLDDDPIFDDSAAECTKWELLGEWTDGSGTCDYGVDDAETISGTDDSAGWENVDWLDATKGGGSDDDLVTDTGNGILAAIKDYCDALRIPEVVDPSDAAAKTGETGGLPGMLRDSELMAFLGGGDPLATMKGYIAEDTRPRGIMQSVAGDLRLGLMAFNSVGAKTECDLAATDTTSKIDKYCPLNNRDGADLLSEIKAGDEKISDDSSYPNGKKLHVDELAEKINDTRAISWTPLGEALYSALGYYTQNSKFCLNVDTKENCLDWCLEVDADGNCTDPADDDPVQYWCQDNHILVITEGESTADINKSIATFAEKPSDYFGPDATDDEKTMAGDADTDNSDADTEIPGECDGGLYGSTYLDDMTWWGQHARPLYKKRYLYDTEGYQSEKNPISTYLVTTGTLTGDGTDECNPATLMLDAAVNGGTETYYSGEDPQKLEDNLYAVLGDIMNRASAGAAASVISNSRSGDGAIYQALFWPRKKNGITDDKGNEGTISWVGNVHALFIDSDNIIYEDTNQNGKLDPDADTDPDKEINIYFSAVVKRARGCYVELVDKVVDGEQVYNQCPTDPEDDCVPGSDCVELEDIKYLWSANEQLRRMDVQSNRKIFTWNDFNNDGMVEDFEGNSLNDTGETFLLKARTKDEWTAGDLFGAVDLTKRGPVVNDFLSSEDYSNFAGPSDNHAYDALNALVTWLQGVDQLDYESVDSESDDNTWIDRPLRSRHYKFVLSKDSKGDPVTTNESEWRLGDVIHSSPITVNKPAENFHLIYRDPTYKDFVRRWTDRRTVVYFGANDGMLHAVNSGFYKDKDRQFYCSAGYTGVPKPGGDCKTDDSSAYNLGEELWAYVPYNLQPHLKCLADKFYDHKYFVDLEPRIADVQIFKEETDCGTDVTADGCIHPHGWGTILVGGMRFGGAAIAAEDLNGLDGTDDKIHDLREFSSSYFILDITDPVNPKVLGELTRTTDDTYVDLNYTTSSPTIVVMRQDAKTSKWYLVMGNGPAALDGTNAVGKQGKIAVLPLDWLTTDKKAIRVPDTLPTDTSEAGVFEVPFPDEDGDGKEDESSASYISNLISMDYNIELTGEGDGGVLYRTDAVYFGTVDGTDFKQYSEDEVKSIYNITDTSAIDIDTLGDQWYWNGGGRVFRLVTRKTDSSGKELSSAPHEWTTDLPDVAGESKGPIRMLMDVKVPVTAGPAAGYDEVGNNFWIYVGTGRFHDEKDKTDDGRCLNYDCTSRTQRAFFALKEPIKDGNDTGASADVCSDAVMTWKTIDWDITNWGTATDGKDEANTENGIGKSLVPGGSLFEGGAAPGKRGLMRTDNILVGADTGYLTCGHLVTQDNDTYKKSWWTTDPDDADNTVCFPVGKSTEEPKGPIYDEGLGKYTFEKLQQYIAGTGCKTIEGRSYSTGLDGWYHVFHDPRERNLNSSLLFNKKLFFSTYQPYNDKCKPEGQSFLYKLSHTTGTGAWNDLIDPADASTANKGSGESPFGEAGAGFGGGSSSESSSGNPGELHEFKSPVRGLANVGSAGAAGSGGEFYAEKPDPPERESNKLNWSDRCGQ
ncbi:MAG: hypothetical protein D3906_00760, partial [Candidatus Electrothrix sp. AUS1_2]|nr:hypothetical protein [Candidatus Electrothrix sp. AUS1_2]